MRVSIAVIRWIRDKVPAALRRLLIKHEAERVPCRVQVNPEGRPGLHISLAGTQREHVLLTDIEIRHIEVQVSLLRVLVTRPHRRLVARSTLESQRSAAITAQLHPVVVVTVGLPTRDRSVELRQGTRVTAIERYQTEPCNTSHAANSTGDPDSLGSEPDVVATVAVDHGDGWAGYALSPSASGRGVVGQGVVGVAGVLRGHQHELLLDRRAAGLHPDRDGGEELDRPRC
jgi:hypothetical protein